MRKPFKVGLTGGIGSGKSTVLKLISKMKVPVLQTDLIGHKIINEKNIKNELVNKFGNEIVGKNGKVNRRILGRKVFQNPRKQKWLNELIHPLIRKFVFFWIKRQQKLSFPIVVVEVPLLFERGYFRQFDGVLSVSAPGQVRRKRLSKRGWTKMEIFRREKLQWTQSKKNEKADWVIINQNFLKDLKYSVDRWLETIKRITNGQRGIKINKP